MCRCVSVWVPQGPCWMRQSVPCWASHLPLPYGYWGHTERPDRWDSQQRLMRGLVHLYYFPKGITHTHTNRLIQNSPLLPGCSNYCLLISVMDRRRVCVFDLTNDDIVLLTGHFEKNRRKKRNLLTLERCETWNPAILAQFLWSYCSALLTHEMNDKL